MNVQNRIDEMIKASLSFLQPPLLNWAEKHTITPRKIRLFSSPTSQNEDEFWLVTDHIGTKDSSYRVIYDEKMDQFGLECTLDNGRHWMMGLYGGFADTIKSM